MYFENLKIISMNVINLSNSNFNLSEFLIKNSENFTKE